jgi:hypothetical protein
MIAVIMHNCGVATALCNDTVNKRDEDTFVHTFVRLMQARTDCNDLIAENQHRRCH